MNRCSADRKVQWRDGGHTQERRRRRRRRRLRRNRV
jgi:hypothetical protein